MSVVNLYENQWKLANSTNLKKIVNFFYAVALLILKYISLSHFFSPSFLLGHAVKYASVPSQLVNSAQLRTIGLKPSLVTTIFQIRQVPQNSIILKDRIFFQSGLEEISFNLLCVGNKIIHVSPFYFPPMFFGCQRLKIQTSSFLVQITNSKPRTPCLLHCPFFGIWGVTTFKISGHMRRKLHVFRNHNFSGYFQLGQTKARLASLPKC